MMTERLTKAEVDAFLEDHPDLKGVDMLLPDMCGILRGKRIGFSLAECKELIDLYDPSGGNRKQLETFMNKIAARRAQLEQQLLDIQQMQLELDTAEERCLAALAETNS
mgnify:CR=1 FL=1